jgi:hypothetical protein
MEEKARKKKKEKLWDPTGGTGIDRYFKEGEEEVLYSSTRNSDPFANGLGKIRDQSKKTKYI